MNDFDSYLAQLPPDIRDVAMKALGHSWSFCTFDGRHVPHSLEKENLFEVVLRRERYVVDSNINWKAEAAKSQHSDKAFIVCRALADETPHIRGLLFSNVRHENNNVFLFGTDYLAPEPKGLMLERLDAAFFYTFTAEGLKNSAGGSEEKRKRVVTQTKQNVLAMLDVNSVAKLGSPRALTELRGKLKSYVNQNVPACKLNLKSATNVSYACYALLLVDKLAERNKFSRGDDLNIFNDTLLLQTALMISGILLTDDRGLRRLGRYAGIKSFSAVPPYGN